MKPHNLHIISHRGNLNGPNPNDENKIFYVENTLENGFDVEVDLWMVGENLFLGHDEPQYRIDLKWLEKFSDRLWVHCKNLDAIFHLNQTDLNYFWHENDAFTITSKRFIWAFPSETKVKGVVDVLPERYSNVSPVSDIICTDFPILYKRNST